MRPSAPTSVARASAAGVDSYGSRRASGGICATVSCHVRCTVAPPRESASSRSIGPAAARRGHPRGTRVLHVTVQIRLRKSEGVCRVNVDRDSQPGLAARVLIMSHGKDRAGGGGPSGAAAPASRTRTTRRRAQDLRLASTRLVWTRSRVRWYGDFRCPLSRFRDISLVHAGGTR